MKSPESQEIIDMLIAPDDLECARHVDRASSVHSGPHLGAHELHDPDNDPVAAMSCFMELLWVCGDCGAHYPRAQRCPDPCTCGAPRQHFYAPIED